MENQLERQRLRYLIETGPFNRHTHGRGLRLAKVAVGLAMVNFALTIYGLLND